MIGVVSVKYVAERGLVEARRRKKTVESMSSGG